jgi:hypothetical protein
MVMQSNSTSPSSVLAHCIDMNTCSCSLNTFNDRLAHGTGDKFHALFNANASLDKANRAKAHNRPVEVISGALVRWGKHTSMRAAPPLLLWPPNELAEIVYRPKLPTA